MKTSIAVAALAGALLLVGAAIWMTRQPNALVFPNANSRETYFTMHNILPAQGISKGKGVKVGILDHYFAMDEHPDLYAGGVNFLGDRRNDELTKLSSHGYWLALVLHEIAPEARIYALNAASNDEKEMVDAITRAIDWAIANHLDALTYSQAKVEQPQNRQRLDAAVSRAHAANIVTTFIHYAHPGNIFPGPLGQEDGADREPDINILHFDYTVVFVKDYQQFQKEPDPRKHTPPFLSFSSTSPVTAGIVAMMRSVNPTLTPEQCKRILVETSHAMQYHGRQVPHVVDAAAAVERARAMTEPPGNPKG